MPLSDLPLLDEGDLPAGPLAYGQVTLARAGRQRNWHADPDCRVLRAAQQRPGSATTTTTVRVDGATIAEATAAAETLTATHRLHCPPHSADAEEYRATVARLLHDRADAHAWIEHARALQTHRPHARGEECAVNWAALCREVGWVDLHAERRNTAYPAPLGPYAAENRAARGQAQQTIPQVLAGRLFGPNALCPGLMDVLGAEYIIDRYERGFPLESPGYGLLASAAETAATARLHEIANSDPDLILAAAAVPALTPDTVRDLEWILTVRYSESKYHQPLPWLFVQHLAGRPGCPGPDAWTGRRSTGSWGWSETSEQAAARDVLHADCTAAALTAMRHAFDEWLAEQDRPVLLLWNGSGRKVDTWLTLNGTPAVPVPYLVSLSDPRDPAPRLAVVPYLLAEQARGLQRSGWSIRHVRPLPGWAAAASSPAATAVLAGALSARMSRRRFGIALGAILDDLLAELGGDHGTATRPQSWRGPRGGRRPQAWRRPHARVLP